ncbi:hypothetical protein [Dyadobacter frigoris]|uniref:Uncharacterized protein n=1 Tax=Dyadobacter frigoris TaxID=2576211 RepID=A0A4U6D880_9BACT|nr:hypothetical protein [Dyadobacter frigoris]TKT92775.1 hypothetical protein FDK13_08200 [Dyadobacter frigoris]GLU51676.1 hypothetical protein Dfri01_11370 [Dyadobacter frigoris]
MEKKVENQFLVSLEGLHLSEDQKKRINEGIQEIVMKELAHMDALKEYGVGKKKGPFDFGGLHPFIWGIWWDDARNRIIQIGNGF